MGKKLQGAKLRAKKRAQEAVNALQEIQAETVALSTVSAAPDDQLFVIDAKGDAHSKIVKNAIATGSFPKKKKATTTKGCASRTESAVAASPGRKTITGGGKKTKNKTVDEELVDKLLRKNKNDADALQRLAKRGREAMPLMSSSSSSSTTSGRPPRKKRWVSNARIQHDLWQNKSDDTVSRAATEPSEPAPPPAHQKPVSGIAQPHAPIKARTYRASSSSLSSSSASRAGSQTVPDASPLAALVVVGVPVEVARPGQSYHPDPVQHSQQLQVAYEVERRRLAAAHAREQPLARGLSDETKQYLVGDSDTDHDDDDDEGGVGEEDEQGTISTAAGANAKKVDKLTTAQRHKQKRLREEKAEIENRRAEKRLRHQLSELPKYKKELSQKERERNERRARLQALKEATKRAPGSNVEVALSQKDPLQAPTVPVALPSELGGHLTRRGAATMAAACASLRTIKPKGSLVLDRVHSMGDRNLAVTKNRRASAPRKRRIKVQGHVSGPGFDIKG